MSRSDVMNITSTRETEAAFNLAHAIYEAKVTSRDLLTAIQFKISYLLDSERHMLKYNAIWNSVFGFEIPAVLQLRMPELTEQWLCFA